MKVFGVAEPGALAVEIELADPTLQGKEVLINITHSGVCHSDVHCQEGFFDLGSAGKLPLTASGVQYPAVFGHEIVGTIAAVGPESSLQPGDTHYIVFPWIGCGQCRACQADRENYCPRGRNLSVALRGGFAQQVWVPHERYLIELGKLEPAFGATLACSGVTTYSAINKVLPLTEGETVAVIGAGGLGLMAVAILSALGQQNIAVVDVNDDNLAIARSLGATVTVNSAQAGEEGPAAALIAACGGKIPAAIDLVNNGNTASLALGALHKGGTLVSVGLFGGEHTYPTALLALQCLTIKGNFVGSLPELKELVQLAQDHELPRVPITTRPLTAEAVNESLADLAAGRGRGRFVLVAAQ